MKAIIGVLPGDGVGPEVTQEAVRVLKVVAERWEHRFEFRRGLIGGAAMEATDAPFPTATRELTEECDAVLLGAVGGPRWSDPNAHARPEQGLLALRATMGTYANLRPVRARASLKDATPLKASVVNEVDIMFVRELTGGIYFGAKHREFRNGDERAVDECAYTAREIERVAVVAGQLATVRRGRVTSVDKANVLETSRLWRRTLTRTMAEKFPRVALDHVLVDTFAMQLMRMPASFDVVVTDNLFGDILTDEAAVLAASIGLLPSGSLGAESADGRRIGLYEPVHGSAPDIAGRGLANPAGAMLSAAMLLRHSLGLEEEALAVEAAVDDAITAGWRTPDLPAADGRHACTTAEFGDQVVSRLDA